MSVSPLHLEAELLRRISERDQAAFRLVYDKYRKRIYTFSLRLLKSAELAEEIVQETFLKIWLMEDELNKVSHLEPYLVTICRNKCLDVLRQTAKALKSNHIRTQNWSESHNETEELILLQDTNDLLQAGIERLPTQQKRVYQLCRQQGLKYEEAAAEMNISPLTVKTHMQQALRSLRVYMNTHTDLAVALIILKLL
ncbi:RNA polymerase sigma factor [Pedobacter caeni]|uniref:RNA polymerase sigma factor n=1 Tax=Pedobacter caeni TaxID=288992 RepID=A0A1M5L6M2_9SPHI|nr:RNA polymerase sigma-70 factor [Pedobacter caeni]SHG60565.1 RNA polymerase sigma-70 factor, ECF subfamily [Pedobacter caeni]